MTDGNTISVQTDLIGLEVEAYRLKIIEMLDMKPEKVILDFSNVKVIDSSGIGMLIAAKNSADGIECDLVLKALSPDIKKMFQIMRLTDHFKFEN